MCSNTENTPEEPPGEKKLLNLDKSDSAGNFTGTQAGGTINNSLHALDVGLPSTIGTSVGVGYFDTKANTFSAEITFGHSGTSFVLSESQRSYYIKHSRKKQVFIGNFSNYFNVFLFLNGTLSSVNKNFTSL